MSLIERAKNFGSFEHVDFNGDTLLQAYETPIYNFVDIVHPLPHLDALLYIVARNSFDEKLAQSMISTCELEQQCIDGTKPIQLFCLSCKTHPFNQIAIVDSACHLRFEADADLHSRTIEAFPVFRGEFSVGDTAEIVRLVRSDFIDTVDWKRDFAPRVWTRFDNKKTGEATTGVDFGLSKIQIIERVLGELADDGHSFIELKNYLGQSCRITVENAEYQAVVDHECHRIPFDQTIIGNWLESFLANAK